MSVRVVQRIVLATDGLPLAVEDAGPRFGIARAPLLCLAGLTRSMRDFHALRDHFAGHPTEPRRVVLMDARGRGQSGYAPNASSYTPQQEADDAAQVACALGLHGPVIIGTSRGGIIAMALALMRPGLMAGSVLNDIGPRIAMPGLLRLKDQLGGHQVPESWEAAIRFVRSAMGGQFSAFDDDDWRRYAHLSFKDEGGKPAFNFDPAILSGLAALPEALPAIDLTGPFKALVTRPMLMLRGGNSDLLDEDTLADAARMGACIHRVPGEGHAPALRGHTLTEIDNFLRAQTL